MTTSEPVPSVNAEMIRWPTFSVVRRGFDQKQVLEYAARVADMVQILDAEVERLRDGDGHAGRALLPPNPTLSGADPSSGPDAWPSPPVPVPAAVDAEEIRRPAFSVVRQGFDRQEVLEYSAQVADIVQGLSLEIRRLRSDGERSRPGAGGAVADTAPDTTVEDIPAGDDPASEVSADPAVAAPGDPYRDVASHVAVVLRALDRDVRNLRKEAEREAETLRQTAADEAKARLRDAVTRADARLREAEAAAESRLHDAETQAETILTTARAEADRRIADAAAAEAAAQAAAAAGIERVEAVSADLVARRNRIVDELTSLSNRLLTMVEETSREAERAEHTVTHLEDGSGIDPASVSAAVVDASRPRDGNGSA
jgi:cell division septum initiation protein DivIVA